LYDLVRDRVKPQRDANKRRRYRELWWRFGEPQVMLRDALDGLRRYIATPETAKHRFFTFLDVEIAPDYQIVCVASDAAWVLGVLSSKVHVTWTLAVGSTLEDRPRYNNTTCFEPFPFPDLNANHELRDRIANAAERLDQHRKDAIARDERVTMTGMYNVLEKL